MEKDKKLIITGVFTAIGASLCCITPALALISGVTGIASSFSWVEPLRPYLIGITLVVLGFAWYQKLKPKKEIECDCEADEKSSFLQSKLFLGIVTIFAFLMLAFPYYSENFFPNRSKKILIVDEPSSNDSIMTIKAGNIAVIHLDIEGMTCTSCNYTVQNASLSVPGVFEAKADYKTAKATIKFDKSVTNTQDIIQAINQTEYHVK
jgi:copper chaperone CopZ